MQAGILVFFVLKSTTFFQPYNDTPEVNILDPARNPRYYMGPKAKGE